MPAINRAILIAFVIATCSRIAWAQYTAYELGGSHGQAFGINNSGTIVGDALIPGNFTEHAVSYNGGLITDVGTLAYPITAVTRTELTIAAPSLGFHTPATAALSTPSVTAVV